jgi:hypothetical protein
MGRLARIAKRILQSLPRTEADHALQSAAAGFEIAKAAHDDGAGAKARELVEQCTALGVALSAADLAAVDRCVAAAATQGDLDRLVDINQRASRAADALLQQLDAEPGAALH